MKRFVPLAVLLPALLWAGCGGKKSSSSSTTSTVTVTVTPATVSVPAGTTQQFTASVTGSTNTAVTWDVAGIAGGDAVNGTISSTGLYTAPIAVPTTPQVTVAAISQASASGIGSAVVTLTAPAISVTVSPKTANVAAGNTQAFTASVTGGPTNTVTWSLRGCSAVCGSIDPNTGIYTAPASPPQESITVVATSKDNATFFDSAQVTVQFGNASLKGAYVFLSTQPDNATGAGFALRGGVFTADGGGNITQGVEDANSASGPSAALPITGTYSIGADGRGTATISDPTQHKFSFALTSNSRGQLIGFDANAASGFLRLQDQTAITGVSGPFVFELAGDNSGPAAEIGELNF
ncbi:MAG: hypothetical protein JO065_08665, partial [Acidobacteria bacterium]|nr:hypothetical protein [Acidobacteriota bacterium]